MDNRLRVDERVLAALSKTQEELSKMTLGQFLKCVIDKGYNVKVGPFRETIDGEAGHLHVTMDHQEQTAVIE